MDNKTFENQSINNISEIGNNNTIIQSSTDDLAKAGNNNKLNYVTVRGEIEFENENDIHNSTFSEFATFKNNNYISSCLFYEQVEFEDSNKIEFTEFLEDNVAANNNNSFYICRFETLRCNEQAHLENCVIYEYLRVKNNSVINKSHIEQAVIGGSTIKDCVFNKNSAFFKCKIRNCTFKEKIILNERNTLSKDNVILSDIEAENDFYFDDKLIKEAITIKFKNQAKANFIVMIDEHNEVYIYAAFFDMSEYEYKAVFEKLNDFENAIKDYQLDEDKVKKVINFASIL